MKLIFIEDSLGKEYSGEFNSVREAYEFYQQELDDEDIIIARAYMELPELKKFALWYYLNHTINYEVEMEVAEYGYDEDGAYRTATGEEIIPDLPIIFKNEPYQSMFEEEIIRLIKDDLDD